MGEVIANAGAEGLAALEWFTVRVGAIRSCAAGVVAIELRAVEGQDLPGWTPGAHVEIDLGSAMIRHYSLCGDPRHRDRWRIAVLRERDGRGGSAWIHERLRVGDRLTVRGPRNNFGLVEAEQYVFVAGGIGITPILPMVTRVAATGRPWTLLYGGRSRSSMAFTDELRDIGGGDLHLVPEDEFGVLDLATHLGAPRERVAVYCCGPEPLIAAVERQCACWPSGSLHRERFGAVPPRAVRAGGFEVVLARSGTRLSVPADDALLDTLEAAGVALDNSCRAGICGTCLVGVLDGVPEHHDDVLTDDERDGGAVMLPCVSRSRTDVLVLDL